MKKTISIVLPAYNEWEQVNEIYNNICNILDKQIEYTYEIIFINDGSLDNTRENIYNICQKNNNIKWLNLSKNFGKEIAITAWLEYAIWDIVITLDCDGQHPVDKIPEFLKYWKQWYDIVYNKRPKIENATFIKKLFSKLFYRLFNLISDFKLESATTDYRLLDRKVVNAFLHLKEQNRVYRWLIDWLWFNKKALIFDALPNKKWRKPSYSFFKLVKLAINSITSFSFFPLKLVWYFWWIITFVSIVLLIIALFDKLWFTDFQFSNLAIVVILNTILIWVVLMSLGMMSLYIASIHREVLWRPLYIVKESTNFSSHKTIWNAR